jgi:hypothetical protein
MGKHNAWEEQHRLDKLVVIPKGKRRKLTPSDTDSKLQLNSRLRKLGGNG